jgi:hypothetical protein
MSCNEEENGGSDDESETRGPPRLFCSAEGASDRLTELYHSCYESQRASRERAASSEQRDEREIKSDAERRSTNGRLRRRIIDYSRSKEERERERERELQRAGATRKATTLLSLNL